MRTLFTTPLSKDQSSLPYEDRTGKEVYLMPLMDPLLFHLFVRTSWDTTHAQETRTSYPHNIPLLTRGRARSLAMCSYHSARNAVGSPNV